MPHEVCKIIMKPCCTEIWFIYEKNPAKGKWKYAVGSEYVQQAEQQHLQSWQREMFFILKINRPFQPLLTLPSLWKTPKRFFFLPGRVRSAISPLLFLLSLHPTLHWCWFWLSPLTLHILLCTGYIVSFFFWTLFVRFILELGSLEFIIYCHIHNPTQYNI